MWALTLALVCGTAEAADGPALAWRESVIVAGHPGGVLSDAVFEYRVPALRFGGAVFNDTFVGPGIRVSASPAHGEVGARLSAQPIDVLPLVVEAAYTQYWKSPFGLLDWPVSDLSGGTRGIVRKPRYPAKESFAGSMWTVAFLPTFQIRAGPVVAFSAWNLSWIDLVPWEEQDEPWFFEPYRGLIADIDHDLLVDHTSAVLWEAMDGEERALLRVGPVLRGKWSDRTTDGTLTAGAVGQWKPGTSVATPTLTGIVTWYLIDPDYRGVWPFGALVVTWSGEIEE